MVFVMQQSLQPFPCITVFVFFKPFVFKFILYIYIYMFLLYRIIWHEWIWTELDNLCISHGFPLIISRIEKEISIYSSKSQDNYKMRKKIMQTMHFLYIQSTTHWKKCNFYCFTVWNMHALRFEVQYVDIRICSATLYISKQT